MQDAQLAKQLAEQIRPAKYHRAIIALHWLMLLLLIAVYACIELREFFPKGSDPRKALKMWHFMLGLSVLLFAVIRLTVRLKTPRPAIIPNQSPIQEALAKGMHAMLYILMIGMPLGGWLILSGEGNAIPFFGLELPALIGKDKALASMIEGIHKSFGTVGYYLIGIHAAAGLYHHYGAKDNTLKRILP